MKLGRRKVNGSTKERMKEGISRPLLNQSKKNASIYTIAGITLLLILWVVYMGIKAERTVTIVMMAQDVYKNQVITEEMLKPYKILQGEFEKYAVVDENGVKRRRLILWDERSKIINSFAAYPLKKDTYAEYRDFIKSRLDNKDTVMYTFPGKEIVPLKIEQNELEAFKSFLRPGDRLNVQAVFSEKVTTTSSDGFGGVTTNKEDVFKTETVFGDIMVADLLNAKGESILDIYEWYNTLSVWDQAKLDASQQFKDRTTPKTLLVALTSDEKERYYYYLSKPNISFKVSLPQRVR